MFLYIVWGCVQSVGVALPIWANPAQHTVLLGFHYARCGELQTYVVSINWGNRLGWRCLFGPIPPNVLLNDTANPPSFLPASSLPPTVPFTLHTS
jgi:hypothetical protein